MANTVSINDRLGDGGLENVAILSTDASGNTVLAGWDGVKRQLGDGVRTVLFGDSMTDGWEAGLPQTAVSFDSATGVMTFTLANHNQWTGKRVRVWSYTYPSIRIAQEVTLTRISSSQFSCVLTGATDVPASPTNSAIFCQGRSENRYTSWVGLYQMRNGHRLNIVKNLAQNGEDSIGLAARVHTLQAENPQLVLMQMTGINDEIYTTPTKSAALTNANNAAAIDGILATGAKLVLLTITPTYSGHATAIKAAMGRVIQKNKFLRDYCKNKANVVVIDAWREIVDPTSTSGFAQASLLAADLIHYSHKGALKVCKKVEAQLNTWFSPSATTLPCSPMDSGGGGKLTVTSATSLNDVVTINSTGHAWRAGDSFHVKKMSEAAANGVFTVKDVPSANSLTYDAPGTGTATLGAGSVVVTQSGQAFANPLFLTLSGTLQNGVTGTAATDVASKMVVSNQAGNTGTLTAAASVGAAPGGVTPAGSVTPVTGGIGNEQRITVTAAALNDRPYISTYGSSAFTSDLQLNRKYRFEGMLRIDSTSWANTPISELYFVVDLTWSTGEVYSMALTTGWDGVEAPMLNENVLWHMRSGEIATTPPQAGSTISNAQYTGYIRFSDALSGGATLVMGLSQFAINDVGAA